MTAVERKVFARQMEVFAGFAEHTDHEISRLHDYIESIGELDNTVFIFMLGDNGASAEGLANGLFSNNTYFNGIPESIEDLEKQLPKFGGRESYGHFVARWAVAGNAPFKWTKQIAGDFGGTVNGIIIEYPQLIKDKGQIRNQFYHVIDIAPAILELCRVPQPVSVNGVKQEPIQGVSMVPSFTNAGAPENHKTQYFENGANLGIYHDGWMARTVHRAAWETTPRRALKDDVCDLFNVMANKALTSGKHTIVFKFDHDGVGLGKGGTGTFFIDGVEAGKGRIENTNANMFGFDEGADVGLDEATNVSKNYKAGKPSKFNGKIEQITIERVK